MPVHISGRSCDMTNIIKIAKKKIKVIEDAAEAFLSKNKKYLGTIGDMDVSYHQIKYLHQVKEDCLSQIIKNTLTKLKYLNTRKSRYYFWRR